MRAAFIIITLLIAGCAQTGEGTWMGKPLYEVTARVGQPDRIVKGYMGAQAQELSTKYGQYIQGSPYQDLQYVTTVSPRSTETYDTYVYLHPKLHDGGRLNCDIHLIVSNKQTIGGWGSTCADECSRSDIVDRWMEGKTFPDACHE